MMVIHLDFSAFETIDEVHSYLNDAFEFPEPTGKNWDAFWDRIRYWYLDEGEVLVEVVGFDRMDKLLRDYCAPFFDILSRVRIETPNVKVKIIE